MTHLRRNQGVLGKLLARTPAAPVRGPATKFCSPTARPQVERLRELRRQEAELKKKDSPPQPPGNP